MISNLFESCVKLNARTALLDTPENHRSHYRRADECQGETESHRREQHRAQRAEHAQQNPGTQETANSSNQLLHSGTSFLFFFGPEDMRLAGPKLKHKVQQQEYPSKNPGQYNPTTEASEQPNFSKQLPHLRLYSPESTRKRKHQAHA